MLKMLSTVCAKIYPRDGNQLALCLQVAANVSLQFVQVYCLLICMLVYIILYVYGHFTGCSENIARNLQLHRVS